MENAASPNDEIRNSLFKRIAVPLDGTDVAEGILPYICEVARKTGVPLLLHSVVDPDAIEYPTSVMSKPPAPTTLESGFYGSTGREPRQSRLTQETGVVYRDQVEASALANAEDRLNGIAGRLKDEGVRVEVRATLGNPAEEILRVADEEGCGLIGMSTHGRNPVARSILGSVTDKVIHSSTLPVLTIRPEKAEEHREREEISLTRVMVPLDGSELAERALPYAGELAQSLSLTVLLARVVSIELPVYAYGGYPSLSRLTNQLAPQAAIYLDGAAQGFRRQGLTVQHRVLQGTPTHALLGLAHETAQDIIVMTTHGRSGLSRWLMGSVTEAMIRASGDPVLVIPSNTRSRESNE